MKNNTDKMTVQVIVNGRPVKTYKHNGQTYIEGKHSTQYSIRIHNNTFGRICAVVSVDGLDVISGERATPNSQGYLISSKSYIDIEGFRASEDHVGAFKFSTKNDSYAATKGSKAVQNVGVIGAIAYAEKVAPPVQYSYNLYSGNPTRPKTTEPYWLGAPTVYNNSCGDDIAMAACTTDWRDGDTRSVNYCATVNDAPKKLAAFDMGTTWGDKVTSRVTYSEFTRGDQIADHELHYASRNALLGMGVDLYPKPAIEQMPSAFDRKFAEPPKGWP